MHKIDGENVFEICNCKQNSADLSIAFHIYWRDYFSAKFEKKSETNMLLIIKFWK